MLVTMKMMKTLKRFGKPGVTHTWFGLLLIFIHLFVLKDMTFFFKVKDIRAMPVLIIG